MYKLQTPQKLAPPLREISVPEISIHRILPAQNCPVQWMQMVMYIFIKDGQGAGEGQGFQPDHPMHFYLWGTLKNNA